MRSALAWLIVCGFVGCSNPKIDNPVLDPPPRRVSQSDADSVSARGQVDDTLASTLRSVPPADVVQTAAVEQASDELFESQVVATVNGAPIFAHEVLEQWAPVLKEMQAQLPPAEFERRRQKILEANLKNHIDRILVVERLKETLKPDQLEALEQHLDQQFEGEVARLKAELQASTRTELELELRKRGTSLDSVRRNWGNLQMAREYLMIKAERPEQILRQDLVEFYQAHLDDFAIPAKVRWEQIQVSHDKLGGKQQALETVGLVLAELNNGGEFAEVARAYSDGPRAGSGGAWDWTQAGSLSDAQVEEALFSLPVGRISPVIEGERAYHVVRVVERRAADRKPFEVVQNEIEKKLAGDRQADIMQVLDDLFETAVIETDVDYQTPPQP